MMLSHDLTNIVNEVLSPLFYILDPSQRLFWLFIFSSIALAVFLTLREMQGDWKKLWRCFTNSLGRGYWLHPSSLFDVKLLFFNKLLRVTLFAPLIIGQLSVTIWVTRSLYSTLGDPTPVDWSWGVIMTLFTITLFVCEDFSRFFLHYLMHRIPLLWRFHRTHHSAEVLTPLTLYRSHPVEVLLFALRNVLVVGIVSGVFVYMFRGRISGWEILGVDALGFLFNLIGANLRHSQIWLSFGVFEKVFISPAQHQIHHSKAAQHRNKNFGVALALWDQLFQSWYPSETKKPKIEYGLSQSSKQAHQFRSLLSAFRFKR